MKQVKSTVWILLCSCSIISLYVYSNASWAVKSRTGDCTYPEQQQPDAGVLRQQTEKVDHTADRSSALRVGSNNIPTIDQLARVDEQEYSCPAGTIPVFSKPASNTTSTQRPGYKIPFAIHQTCKSRCVSEEVYGYMQQWSNLGIPYYLHDDEAMEALVLSEAAKDFPQLQVIWTQCLRVPAARADLWRMLLLWTYGGIYADIDTRPNKFRPLTHIHPDDEVYALSDNEGLPSFHFFAAMPRHPLVYLVIQRGLNNVMLVSDVAAYNPARFTGPKAMRQALRTFVDGHDDANNTQHQHVASKDFNFTFHGMGGHTVRREGPKDLSEKIVVECAIQNKREKYKAFNLTHYMDSGENKLDQSCFDALYQLTTKHRRHRI